MKALFENKKAVMTFPIRKCSTSKVLFINQTNIAASNRVMIYFRECSLDQWRRCCVSIRSEILFRAGFERETF